MLDALTLPLAAYQEMPLPPESTTPATASAPSMESFLAGAERRAFVLARMATRDADEALDIVQDAMIALVTRYRARPAAEWGPLFHTILQSRIRDWHRRRRVRSRWQVWFGARDADGEREDLLDNVADPQAAAPPEQIAARRGISALEIALERLPARQQQAFLLRAWEGLDVAGAARAMRCSQGSVKTHYFRALRALRARLGDDWT
jgi:RNA polymerase sigma-70 factor (ECF subfamily)